jgi:sulfur carrier protein
MTAELTVNGVDRPLPADPSVGALVAELTGGVPPAGIAVALNDDVVPRSAWERTTLHPGDRVEVLTAMQGG